MVADIQTAQEFEKHLKSPGLVVVKYYADWCGPCRMMTPIFDAMTQKYTCHAAAVNVDKDGLEDVCEEQGVQSLPTFKFYKNGSQVGMVLGANKERLEAAFVQHSA